ncbi:MAG: hypothetical protein JF628_08180 [Sphingomonas sp.]|nr:hypothetical protein [Sphingomonas sp.]
MQLIARGLGWARALWPDADGLAMTEFALGAPLLMVLGAYGVEVANLAITNMRISQYALQIADNASRIGVNNGLASFQVAETDINDVMQGLRMFGAGSKLTQFGRVTLSSLENVKQNWDAAAVQRIHWQRCIGVRGKNADGTVETGYDSSYGTTSTAAGTVADAAHQGTDKPAGIGDAASLVNAPANSGVMFVEINYEYQPLFGTLFVNKTKLHYVASAIIRDKRDFSQIMVNSGVAATCNLYNL